MLLTAQQAFVPHGVLRKARGKPAKDADAVRVGRFWRTGSRPIQPCHCDSPAVDKHSEDGHQFKNVDNSRYYPPKKPSEKAYVRGVATLETHKLPCFVGLEVPHPTGEQRKIEAVKKRDGKEFGEGRLLCQLDGGHRRTRIKLRGPQQGNSRTGPQEGEAPALPTTTTARGTHRRHLLTRRGDREAPGIQTNAWEFRGKALR